ncbi:phage integrase-like protein [Halorubrum coriense DSM 10284]|uniref:Phage integrase-like protein n=2 Tax=Halorubrum coriense TaxID=64713 RepID=M0E6U6_9EURY|nr:phage integrase-like protein [Halorubrum coriense DSM 10284]
MSSLDEFSDGFPKAESLYDPNLSAQYESGERELNAARRRVVNEDDLTPSEKRTLYEFDRELRNLNNREDRHRKVTRALHVDITRLLQSKSGLLLDILDDSYDGKEALDGLLAWIQDQGYSNNYVHNLLITVQTFGEVLGSEIVQDRVDEIKPGRFRDEGKPPLPGNVINWQDAIEMAKVRSNCRDKALILSEWGLGARPDSELLRLQYKHLKWEDGHYQVTIPWDGKTGDRTIRLFPGAAILRRWIEEKHPVHADPEAELGPDTYLWTKLNSNTQMDYDNLYRIFDEAGEDAGIAKDTNPRHFRRSRASFFAGKPTVSEVELRTQFGWSFDSNSPQHYITRFRTDIDQNVAAADGADVDLLQDKINVTPIECNHCGRWTERHVKNCVCCGGEVEQERHEVTTSATVTDGETDLLSLMMNGEVDAGDLRSVKKLWGVITTREKFYEELDGLIETAERAAGGDKTGLYGGPGAVAAVMAGTAVDIGHRAAAAWATAKHRALSLDPQMEHYPPSPERATAIGAGLGIYLLAVSAYMSHMGMIEPLLAGEATSQLGLVLGLGVGFAMITQAMPDLDEVES